MFCRAVPHSRALGGLYTPSNAPPGTAHKTPAHDKLQPRCRCGPCVTDFAVAGAPPSGSPLLINWGTTLSTAHLRGRPPFRGPRVPFRNPPLYRGSRALRPPLAFFEAGAGSGHCSRDALRRVTSHRCLRLLAASWADQPLHQPPAPSTTADQCMPTACAEACINVTRHPHRELLRQ